MKRITLLKTALGAAIALSTFVTTPGCIVAHDDRDHHDDRGYHDDPHEDVHVDVDHDDHH
jgi:hypothetical protein